MTKKSDKFLIHPSSGVKVTYAAIARALQKSGGAPYKMSLTDLDEIRVVIDCVNAGIDSHLEACYFEGKDKYETVARRIAEGGAILCYALDCEICEGSFPVLLRRLSEVSEEHSECAGSLVADILQTIGIDEYGKFVSENLEHSV